MKTTYHNLNPILGLGFMRHNNKIESQNIVNYAMSNNQNYFETCFFYQNFECENYVYSLLKNFNRNEYQICGKMPIHNMLEKCNFTEIYNQQIKRVPNKFFDYYLLQALSPNCIYWILKYDLINFFNKEKEKGNIKNFGLSIQCDAKCLQTLLELNNWDICQMPLNYFDWYLCESKKNYEILQSKNIPIIAQAPLKGKVLIRDIENLFSNNESLLDNAYSFFNKLNIKIILCGTSTLKHYKENLNALNKKDIIFNEEEAKMILNKYLNNSFIKCINCNQCYLNCPEKLPIPALFQLYNKSIKNYESFLDLQILKQTIDEPIQHCNFLQCNNLCSNVCPFDNNIQKILQNQIFQLRL